MRLTSLSYFIDKQQADMVWNCTYKIDIGTEVYDTIYRNKLNTIIHQLVGDNTKRVIKDAINI